MVDRERECIHFYSLPLVLTLSLHMFLFQDTLEDTMITNQPLRYPERLVINDRQFRQIIHDMEIIGFPHFFFDYIRA